MDIKYNRGSLPLKNTVSKFVQSVKQLTPIDITVEGMVIEVKLLHPAKLIPSKDDTDDGIMMEDNLEQFLKHDVLMFVTDDGMVMEVKFVQS